MSLPQETQEPQMPAHLQLDQYHPSNQGFYKTKRGIEQAIVAQTGKMSYKHVIVAKLKLRGKTNKEIREETGYKQNTVSTILARPDVKELLYQLRFMDTHLEGPELALRKHVLWEIAVDAKEEDPRITISAIQELNKIENVYNNSDSSINITINANQLPRGPLDVG